MKFDPARAINLLALLEHLLLEAVSTYHLQISIYHSMATLITLRLNDCTVIQHVPCSDELRPRERANHCAIRSTQFPSSITSKPPLRNPPHALP